MSMFAAFYVVLSFLVAYLARGSRLGVLRSLLFSLFVTPFVVMLYLLIQSTLEREELKKRALEND